MFSAMGLPLVSSRPPAPSFSAKAASISLRSWVARYPAPLKALAVSSPQVSAIFTSRLGLNPSFLRRIRVSTQTEASALSSDEPRP